jgi:hypothetical protein
VSYLVLLVNTLLLKIMKIISTQLFPYSPFFLCLMSKYSPQHPVLRTPASYVLPLNLYLSFLLVLSSTSSLCQAILFLQSLNHAYFRAVIQDSSLSESYFLLLPKSTRVSFLIHGFFLPLVYSPIYLFLAYRVSRLLTWSDFDFPVRPNFSKIGFVCKFVRVLS